MQHDRCDLHTHSTCSDGGCTPGGLIELARDAGLRAVALTDHNTVSGLTEFCCRAHELGIESIPGVELSTRFNNKEVHVVGLFIPQSRWASVAAFVESANRAKDGNNRDCINKLNAAGYDIDYDAIRQKNPGARLNRVHIARELIDRGYIQSVGEAFDGLLRDGGPFYSEAPKPPALCAIRSLNALGAVSVLAHIRLDHDFDEIPPLLAAAKAAGLDAVETRYSTYSAEDTAFMERMAREYGLLESGGSDFHGVNKPDIALGSGRGGLTVPYSFCEALKARAKENRL